MKFRSDIFVCLGLFLCGVILHSCYLWSVTRSGTISDLNWHQPDTRSYFQPAEAFLETGMFARGGYPDYHRTIGYPFFLSLFMRLANRFGVDWLHVVIAAQAILFALAYPTIFLMAKAVFGLRKMYAVLTAIMAIALGCFVTYIPFVLADGLFAVFFIIAFLTALSAIRFRSVTAAGVYIVTVTCAANVRPMLVFFPFAVLCFQWVYARFLAVTKRKQILHLMGGMLILATLGVNTPALRNWHHHGVFTPTRIGSINLFDYLAKDVLFMRGERARYEAVKVDLSGSDAPGNVGARIEIRKTEALKVFREYPVEAAAVLLYNTLLNSVETHWQNMFYLYRQTWYMDYADGAVVRSPGPFFIAICFVLLYGVIYLLAFGQVFCLVKNPVLLVGVGLFLIPYAFCGTSYQGARFRLWLEPFVLIAAVRSLAYLSRMYRVSGTCSRPLDLPT